MPDYSKTKIYRLVCKDLQIKQCYIGSTTNWKVRNQNHKKCCNTESNQAYNEKKYIFIRENGGFENWDMVLVENFSCENNLEARQRERYWSEHYASELNTFKPYISKEEQKEEAKEKRQIYYNDNSHAIIQKQKQYYIAHATEIKLQHSEKITCECGAIICKAEKSRHERTKKHNMYIETL